MFSHLPLPWFLSLAAAALVVVLFYAVKLRKGSNKSWLILIYACILNVSVTIIAKCMDYWAPGTTLQSVFEILQIITTIVLVLTLVIMAVWRYRHGYVVEEKKKNFWTGILGMAFGIVLILIVIILSLV